MNLLAAATLVTPIRANGPCGCTLTVGDPVTVDGLQGRGVVVARKGRDLVIRFRDGEYLKRDQRYVHKITSDYVSRYSSNRETNMALNAYGTSEGVKKEWDERMHPATQKNKQPGYRYVRDRWVGGKKVTDLYEVGEQGRRIRRGSVPATEGVDKKWFSGAKLEEMKAGEVTVESELGPTKRPENGYIVQQGALFCVKSKNQMDQNFGCFGSRAEAEEHLRWIK